MNRYDIYPPTSKFILMNFKPNYSIVFHCDGKTIGTLDFSGPEIVFTGNVEESAKSFFCWIVDSFRQRLEEERVAEREACAKVCDEHAKRNYNWASENADMYHAQAHWAGRIASVIRARDKNETK